MTVTRRELLRASALLGAGGALLGASGGITACTTGDTGRQALNAALGPRRRGGVLRIGVTGGGAQDTLDPHHPPTYPDQARVSNLYEPLFGRDAAYNIEPVLAESLEPAEQGRTWTLRLRADVSFHNGKPLDADDVIFTLRRIADLPGTGAAALRVVDMAGLRKIDARTLRIPLTVPYALFQDDLAQYYMAIVPTGFDLAHPVGTGPFRYGTFTPGRISSFPRNDHYWRADQPYVDELVIVDFPSDDARVAALLSGDVQAIDNVPPGQINDVKAAGATVMASESGAWTPFTMRVDKAPFNDVRVRQAFRLMVDRDQMVSQALAGQGRIANDLYAPFDASYASDIPQRRQDLAQAKSLLRQAGQAGLRVELVTSSGIGSGAVEAATLFAQQAKGAGVTIAVRTVDSATFYGSDYLNWVFAEDYWYTRNYLPQVAQGSLPDAPYNECHFNDQRFTSLINRARGELNPAKRAQLLKDAQRIEYDTGGYIIWGFKNQLDAYTNKVTGFVPDRNMPLSSFQFRTISFV
ncbi:ABC transporter substrate-binding protein [Actinocrispum wychmicini]|uniref:Peptide/nickel transport system substrate-binding protein n=1 Tax=Actinocrispum wychmicini TaxID=1213861 RepID=A0A4R2J4P9_9PSEU|nr:ABC transporter substrate-binding protein [Actinocrispum wychmicini]TCO53731.1 peptide/nickel transport system substrate-binding protein [Actinocrispum wychmicini]